MEDKQEIHDPFIGMENNSTCFEEGDVIGDDTVGSEREKVLLTKQSCGRALDAALGIKTGQMKQWVVSQHAATLRSYGYLQKREGITGYRIMMSWKNPSGRCKMLVS